MELNNTVENFEELGLVDPFNLKSSMEVAEMELKIFDFYIDVYPNAVVEACLKAVKEKSNFRPPKCIFIPNKEMMRTMIKALIMWNN